MSRTTQVDVLTSAEELAIEKEMGLLLKKSPIVLSEESDEEAASTVEEDDDPEELTPRTKGKRMVRKSAPEPTDMDGTIDITKTDTKKGLVFGWASVMKKGGELVIDRENDVIDDEWEMEAAAYSFVTSVRVGGDNHVRKGVSHLVESMVFTEEKIAAMGLPEDFPIGWWTGWQITDPDVMKGMAEGKYTGFSVHGKGRREIVKGKVGDMTFNDIDSVVRDALRADHPGCHCYIRDLSSSWVAYEMEMQGAVVNPNGGKVFRRSYTIGTDGSVSLGEASEATVKRITTYVTKGGEALARFNALKGHS